MTVQPFQPQQFSTPLQLAPQILVRPPQPSLQAQPAQPQPPPPQPQPQQRVQQVEKQQRGAEELQALPPNVRVLPGLRSKLGQ
jgi:hypothetical protein